VLRDEIVYRVATEADAYELAAFGSEAFVDAYGFSVTRRQLGSYVLRTYSEELQLREIRDPRAWTMLAMRDDEITGAALLRWADPPGGLSPEEPWAEIARFYLAKMYWETGISSDLMVAVLRSIREQGCELVWLQVWERAERAIHFYRKWGFRDAGEAPFEIGGEIQRDLVMTRSLAPRVTPPAARS
jgi:diamine N-acetyltransferase